MPTVLRYWFGSQPDNLAGARVVYAVSDLNAWADLGTRTSTSDPGVGTVRPAKRHAPIPYAGKERR